jgi:hypothetical protein
MGLIEGALARAAARGGPRRIDYERMNRVHPKQLAALTRAKKSGDPERIAVVCKAAIIEWNEIGAWPDDWHRWQVALDDSLHWSQHIDLRDL